MKEPWLKYCCFSLVISGSQPLSGVAVCSPFLHWGLGNWWDGNTPFLLFFFLSFPLFFQVFFLYVTTKAVWPPGSRQGLCGRRKQAEKVRISQGRRAARHRSSPWDLGPGVTTMSFRVFWICHMGPWLSLEMEVSKFPLILGLERSTASVCRC